jgi:hypothetical protein
MIYGIWKKGPGASAAFGEMAHGGVNCITIVGFPHGLKATKLVQI